MENEFYRKSGLNISEKKFCVKKDKCGSDSIKVLDSDCGVFCTDDEDRNLLYQKISLLIIYITRFFIFQLIYSAF